MVAADRQIGIADAQDAAGLISEASEKAVTMAIDEGDRWWHIEQDRRRERHKLAERARKRAARSVAREETLQRAFTKSTTPNIRMQVTEWTVDELGNLCRKIYAE